MQSLCTKRIGEVIIVTVSDQIIAVMNDLCQKFGIAIDWSQENVIPYLTELAGKYISYEIATSIAWSAIFGAVLLISAIICKIAYKTDNSSFIFFMTIITVFATIIFIVVFSTQLFDIIECLTIPEKTIIEYVSMLLRQM